MTSLIPFELISDVRKYGATLFLGAGASMEAGYPNANGLANRLVERAGPAYQHLRDLPLDDVADMLYMEPLKGEAWVRREIINIFNDLERKLDVPPSRAHDLMTKLPWKTIFTTNYDNIVNRAYNSSKGAVQNFLPIFEPDEQIKRVEESTLKYFYLNGSIEEAGRNSKHQFVLTHNEQRLAYTRNYAFYDLLKQSAINSPIIFIGFQFTHPGAKQSTTSPEFNILRQLTAEIGTTRWHYSVMPYNSDDPYTSMLAHRLEQAKVFPVNATFGEFMQELYESLVETAPPPIELRPDIHIPILRKTLHISAERYENFSTHFEVLNIQHDREVAPAPQDSLNGKATWASFFEKHYIDRHCKPEIMELIHDLSKSEESTIVFFKASAGWGKTFFWKSLASEYFRQRRPVIWLDPFSSLERSNNDVTTVMGTWDRNALDALLADIERTGAETQREHWKPIIVADNCMDRSMEVVSLFRYLKTNGRKFIMIFSGRPEEMEHLESEPSFNFAQPKLFAPQESELILSQEINQLLDFCQTHSIGAIRNEMQRTRVRNALREEDAFSSLILALQVIFDKDHRPFSEIVQGWWDSLDSEEERLLVLRVATFHRYGSSFYPRLYPLMKSFPKDKQAEFWEIYAKCRDERHILYEHTEGELCVSTMHSLVAQRLLQASKLKLTHLDDQLIHVVSHMSNKPRDLELVRRLVKQITDGSGNYQGMSDSRHIGELFNVAAKATHDDWVVCHQASKFLLDQSIFDNAIRSIDKALDSNPNYAVLFHTKGNILFKWAKDLHEDGRKEESEKRFEQASKYLALSRVRDEPDEYGYVTHLNMIRYRLENEKDDIIHANLLAEGQRIYHDARQTIPADNINLLLQERFSRTFNLSEKASHDLCERLKNAIHYGRASTEAACFVAQNLFEQGNTDEAIKYLQMQSDRKGSSPELLVSEAEILTRVGRFKDASRAINDARRNRVKITNTDWEIRLDYWDMLIGIAREDFKQCGDAITQLSLRAFARGGGTYPRGHIWLKEARNIVAQNRDFRKHAKIWRGKVEERKEHSGFISIGNPSSSMKLRFFPHRWRRSNFAAGQFIDFVITILPNSLRADDPTSSPYISGKDDLYI